MTSHCDLNHEHVIKAGEGATPRVKGRGHRRDKREADRVGVTKLTQCHYWEGKKYYHRILKA